MVAHAKKDHEKNVRLNCKVMNPNGTMCSWSCSSFMYCMRHHLERVHNLSNIGKADFPTQYVFVTHTDAPLPKGVSLNYLLTFVVTDSSFQTHSLLCTHYRVYMKTQRGNLTPQQLERVDSIFKSRLAELVVLKLQGDSNTVPKPGDADEADSGGGESSEEEDLDDGEEEEDEGGSEAGDEEDSDAEDSSGSGSDTAGDKDAGDGSEGDDTLEVRINIFLTVALYFSFAGYSY